MTDRRRALQTLAIGGVLAGMTHAARAVNPGLTADERAPAAPGDVLVDKTFGVKGDGRTNDRAALQNAIDRSTGRVLLITGASRIDAAGLDLRTASHVRFAPGASLTLLPHNTPDYQMLRVWNVQRVRIENARLDGSKRLNSARDDPRQEGYGMGISIAGSADVTVLGASTRDCWGDGIYIANSYTTPGLYSMRVHVADHHASGCRRQGASIISGRDIVFERPVWEDIGGTAPSAGLDIEPDSNADILERIRIVQPVTRRCACGILVYLPALPGVVPKNVDIEIDGHRDEGSAQAAFCVWGVKGSLFRLGGSVTSRSPVWVRPGGEAFVGKDLDGPGPRVAVTTPTVTR